MPAGFAEGLGTGLMGGYAQKKHEQFQIQLGQQMDTAKLLLDAAQKPSQDPTQQVRLLSAAYQALTIDPKKFPQFQKQVGQLLTPAPQQGGQAQQAAPQFQVTQPSGMPPALGGQVLPSSIPPPPGAAQGQGGISFLTPQQMEAQRIAAENQAAIEGRKQQAASAGLQEGSEEYKRFMAPGALPPFAHLQKTNVMTPDGKIVPGNYNNLTGQITDETGNLFPPGSVLAGTGATTPKRIEYSGPKGEPLPGFQIGTQLYDRDLNPLPPGTAMFSAAMVPKETKSSQEHIDPLTGERTTLQGDKITGPAGSRLPAPPGAPSAGAQKSAAKPTPKQEQDQRRQDAAFLKQHPEIKKSFDTLNQSQERYEVMTKAMPEALKGDQQSMLNILANHLGMTMGLQKGARMNQALIQEAQQSDPLIRRIAARAGFTYGGDGYLQGVVLTPEQIRSMVMLGKDRMNADKEAYDRVKREARGGYGMSSVPAPPGETKPAAQSAPAKPKTADDYLKSIGHPGAQ